MSYGGFGNIVFLFVIERGVGEVVYFLGGLFRDGKVLVLYWFGIVLSIKLIVLGRGSL